MYAVIRGPMPHELQISFCSNGVSIRGRVMGRLWREGLCEGYGRGFMGRL